MTTGSGGPRPSIDREAVSRPAAELAGPLAAACDLSAYRRAGGTALAWALGHRRSEDLDFFNRVPGHLDTQEQMRLARALRSLDSAAELDMSQADTLHASCGAARSHSSACPASGSPLQSSSLRGSPWLRSRR